MLMKSGRQRNAKVYWLPMPRREAEIIVMQYRLAIENLRRGRAGQIEAQCLAQAVLLANMLTGMGYGKLEPSVIREVLEDLLAMLEHGGATGEWRFPDSGLARLVIVVNEHDRQLREVHLAAFVDCNERLQGMVDSVLRTAAQDVRAAEA
jgi:hypothetical protein